MTAAPAPADSPDQAIQDTTQVPQRIGVVPAVLAPDRRHDPPDGLRGRFAGPLGVQGRLDRLVVGVEGQRDRLGQVGTGIDDQVMLETVDEGPCNARRDGGDSGSASKRRGAGSRWVPAGSGAAYRSPARSG